MILPTSLFEAFKHPLVSPLISPIARFFVSFPAIFLCGLPPGLTTSFLRNLTRNLIGENELAKMKPGAVFIQASRGGVVDEAALAACLAAGRIHGAAVDVYDTEPPGPDSPLLMLKGEAAKRLLLTPHIAGVTRQASAQLFRAAWENVERVLLRNEPPHHRVF